MANDFQVPGWLFSTALRKAVADAREGDAYAGIGSRETPVEVLDLMGALARILSQRGLALRSGGAAGADTAFEAGALASGGVFEGFAPWKGFAGKDWPVAIPSAAFDTVDEFHPAGRSLGQGPRKLMARNAQQVLGRQLDSPSVFVLCWTSDGADGTSIATTHRTGGTGQAIRIAASRQIPVLNLKAHAKRHSLT